MRKLKYLSPRPETVRPKIRRVIKPCRPYTPVSVGEDTATKNINAKGKISRRLRILVQDQRDLPM